MSQANECPECGAAVHPDAPQGCCPACLVRLGAEGLLPPGEFQITASGELVSTRTAHTAQVFPLLFGAYELLGEIGRGGMGVVYRARQVALNRLVALKMLLHGRFSDPAFLDRFHLEAEATAHLDHPNIVPIYEIGVHEAQPYYSMKLIEGRNLEQLIAEYRGQSAEREKESVECGPKNAAWLRRSAELLATIARAVHYAHQHGVLHRDIKPHNILLDAAGQPYLTDFGLAKLLDRDSGLTVSAAVIGSPGFMAPEQAAGKTREVTTAADIYGLGAVLYAMLTGKAVFHADTPVETLRQVIEQQPVRPRALNSAVDRDLETICLKCLQKEPAKRFTSARALAEDLESWLGAEPIQARPPSQAERVWLWCRRRPVRAALTGALLLVFALGSAGVLWQWRRAKAGELFARQNAYAAAMNLAQRALANNEVGQAISLLEKYRPTDKSEPDLRHWEWRYLWQLCQGDELSLLRRYSSAISAVAVSSDGQFLAVAKGPGVPLWDLAARRLVAELPDTSFKLTFSPTKNLLALATWNEAGQPIVRLWDLPSHALVATLTNEANVQSLAFSPDGQLLATLDRHGNMRVTAWKANQIVVTRKLERPIRRVQTGVVTFSPDGRCLVIGGDMGELLLLDLRSGVVVQPETGTADGVTSLAISPSGDLVAAGFAYTDGTIGLWELSTGRARGRLTNHTAFVRALAFTPDGRHLVSAAMDRTIRVWRIADLTESRRFAAFWHGVEALALLPDGKTLVSGAPDGAVCLWDCSAPVRSRGPATLVISHGLGSEVGVSAAGYGPGPPDPKVIRRRGVVFASDSRSFITSEPEGALGVYDARSLQLIEPLPTLGSNNWGVAISPDGHWLAAAKTSGKIEIWDWQAGRSITNLALPFEWVGKIWFSRSSRFLLTGVVANDYRSTVKIWATRDWAEVPAAPIHYPTIVVADLSPDDRLLALAGLDGTVELSRFPSGHPLATFKKGGGYLAVRFSQDGRLLALGRAGGSVELWDVITRQGFGDPLPGHFLTAWSAAFSSDSRRLLTGGRNPRDAVKLWDIATQSELLVLPAEGQIFCDVGYSPDGDTLVASSLGGVAHFWRAPSWAEIEAAEKAEMLPR